MNRAMTKERLMQETLIHRGAGGIRDAVGRVAVLKDSAIAGFVRGGRFYSREDAGRLASGEMAQACA